MLMNIKRLVSFVLVLYAARCTGLDTAKGSHTDPIDVCENLTDSLICDVRKLQIATDESNASQSLEDKRNVISEELRKYMNESADPCENFHDFACGNWITYHPIKSGQYRTRASMEVLRDFDRKIFVQLNNTANENGTESERKVKDFFHSCMNFSLDRSDFEDKLKNLANEFHPMPALVGADEWQEDDFDWLKTVAEIAYKYGIKLIIGYDIVPDIDDHTAVFMGISHQKFKNTNASVKLLRKHYQSFLTDYLQLKTGMAKQVAREIVDFERKLWKATLNSSDSYYASTVQKIHDKYSPELDVRKLMNISYGSIPDGVVYEMNSKYVENLIDIMKKTPKRVVANYISFHLANQVFLGAVISLSDRAQECIDTTEAYFPQILSNIFYRTNKLKEKEQYLDKLWQDIKLNLQMILESSQLSWFDDASREYALEKLHSLKIVVPTYKENNFDEEYASLKINASDYAENIKSLKTFKAMKNRASLNSATRDTDISLHLTTAYYTRTSNTVTIPISVLDADFTSSVYPNALNYAHLGFDVSHELLHGFSGGGRSFNKLGDYVKWWDDDIENEYAIRRKCLYDQYHNYTFGGVPLPQEEMQDENAADNGGLFLAYQAYRHWYEDSARTKEEIEMETLPNLNYTNIQLFFIAYSQSWCAYTEEHARAQIAVADTHSPDEIRAFVPLTNFEAFSKEFKCPKGSPMNPVKKCKIY